MKWVEVPPSTMHCYGDRYQTLYLPGSSSVTDILAQCPAQTNGCSNTCHPLSITKSPVPRWQSCPQPLPFVCPQPPVLPAQPLPFVCPQPPVLPSQPLVQKCLVLYPEPCETTRLLPCRKPSLKFSCQPLETPVPVKKRVARSLPPCAPRCPEPGKLRFPPCGIRSSSSCKDQGRSLKISRCCYGSDLRLQGLTSGYSLPLRGVTECPPQPCGAQCYLQEPRATFPLHKCTKGYPTHECVPTEQRLAKCPPEQKELKCLPGKGGKENSTPKQVAKCSLPLEGAKTKGSSTQHLSKSRCLSPRATHRHHHHSAGVKRSSHPKKSRCAAKWLW